MAVDAYMTARTCPDCAKARIKLRKKASKMKLFPAKAPLEYVSIDILGELPRTQRGNRYLLVITDRFSKLTRTVPLKRITAAVVAEAFTKHWAFVYGPPVYLLSDNGSQFLSKFFLAVCRLLRVSNVFTTAYHPQTNGQVERFNRTISSALRHYLADNQRDWDLFTDALTFGYNSTVNRMTGLKPFELVLTRSPLALSLQNRPTLDSHTGTLTQYKTQYLRWLKALMSTASDTLKKGQDRYKRDYDAKVREPTPEYKVGDKVLVERETPLRANEKTSQDRVNNKLAPLCEGPFEVVEADSHTVTVIRDNGLRERLSKDRVTQFPRERSQPAQDRRSHSESEEQPVQLDNRA